MTPPDLDALDKLHHRLNRHLEKWEKQKLADLIRSFREVEVEIKAVLLNSADLWEQMRIESLLAEIDRTIDRLETAGAQWVKGRNDVQVESPNAGLSVYPAVLGGNTALGSIAVTTASFSAVHLPALTYLQDYDLGLIRSVTTQIREDIRNELKRSLIAGDSIPDAVKRLRNVRFDKGVWPSAEKRAEVIARTEILRASNQGALQVYRQYDVRRVIWLSAADERTCPICGVLHKKIFPINHIPFGAPPAHPRCRCFISGNVAATEAEGQAFDKESAANHKQWVKQLAEQEKVRAAKRKK